MLINFIRHSFHLMLVNMAAILASEAAKVPLIFPKIPTARRRPFIKPNLYRFNGIHWWAMPLISVVTALILVAYAFDPAASVFDP